MAEHARSFLTHKGNGLWAGSPHLIWMLRGQEPDQMVGRKKTGVRWREFKAVVSGKKRKRAFLFHFFNRLCLWNVSRCILRKPVCFPLVCEKYGVELMSWNTLRVWYSIFLKIVGSSHPKLMISLNWLVTSGLSYGQYILNPFKNKLSGYQNRNFLLSSVISVKSTDFCLSWMWWTNGLLSLFYL